VKEENFFLYQGFLLVGSGLSTDFANSEIMAFRWLN